MAELRTRTRCLNSSSLEHSFHFHVLSLYQKPPLSIWHNLYYHHPSIQHKLSTWLGHVSRLRELLGGADMYACGIKWVLALSSAKLWSSGRWELCLSTSLPAYMAEHALWNFMQNALSFGKFLHLSLSYESSCLFWFQSPLPPTRSPPLSLTIHLVSLTLILVSLLEMTFPIISAYHHALQTLSKSPHITTPALSFQDTALSPFYAQVPVVWELKLSFIFVLLRKWG